MSRFFNYNKEGPGVSREDVLYESPVKRACSEFFHRFWQLVLLNVLYLIACVPIITIGPATAAMNYVCRNASQGKPVSFFTDFIEKCKEHFKQGIAVWLIQLAVGALLVGSYFSWTDVVLIPASSAFRTVAVVVIFFFGYLLLFGSFYLYPMMVSFDLSIKQLIRNSSILCMTQLWRNLVLLATLAVLVILTLFLDILFLPFHLFISFSLINYVSNALIFPVLKRYVATPEEPAEEPEAPETLETPEAPVYPETSGTSEE